LSIGRKTIGGLPAETEFCGASFSTVLGANVPSYNLPGITELKFTPKALAGIFLGRITKWNDGEIVKANPSLKLPAADIVVVHRSDASGTTYVWTDYLSKVSSEWKSRVGKGTSVKWPVGIGGKGNEGELPEFWTRPLTRWDTWN
jgi:phosphate transport system substrate-binding protein